MGSIRIEIAGGVVGTAKGKVFTVSDADINRLVAWARARYTLIPPGQEPIVPTLPEALIAWANSFVERTRDDVLNWERSESAKVSEPAEFTAT